MNRSPALVDEDRALAAHGLADERHRALRDVERGRMELDELQVGENRARARREREALAEAAGRVGAVLVKPADAAGRDHDLVGRKQRRASGSDRARSPRTALSSTTSRRASKPSSTSIEGVARAAATSARINSRPVAVSAGMDDAAPAMRGLEPKGEAAVRRAVEAHAEARELFDGGGRGRTKRSTIAASQSPSPAAIVSAGMQRRASSSGPSAAAMPPCAQTRRRPRRRAAPSIRSRPAAGASSSAVISPATPAADDDDAPRDASGIAVISASIRSTARRAPARRRPGRSSPRPAWSPAHDGCCRA